MHQRKVVIVGLADGLAMVILTWTGSERTQDGLPKFHLWRAFGRAETAFKLATIISKKEKISAKHIHSSLTRGIDHTQDKVVPTGPHRLSERGTLGLPKGEGALAIGRLIRLIC